PCSGFRTLQAVWSLRPSLVGTKQSGKKTEGWIASFLAMTWYFLLSAFSKPLAGAQWETTCRVLKPLQGFVLTHLSTLQKVAE
ncbi:MAG: hypothetical protein LBD53_00775, partial [Tannerella sp.]|nr:hypothetical protein [Tannerella sp.]